MAVAIVGLVGAACSGEIVGEPEMLVQIDERSPVHVSGIAALGADVVRFEAVSNGTTTGHVILELDHGSVAYGISVDDNDYWSDGNGLTLQTDDVELMRRLTIALTDELNVATDEPAMVDVLLVSSTAYLSQAPVGFAIPSRSRPLTAPTGDVGDGAIYSTVDDRIVCVKRDQWVQASWDWPDSRTDRTLKVNDGGSCLGKCGDCGFGMGQSWTLDCLEHDACIQDAARKGLPVIGQSPWDYYCGDEWLEAENDFLYGWLWPYRCNG